MSTHNKPLERPKRFSIPACPTPSNMHRTHRLSHTIEHRTHRLSHTIEHRTHRLSTPSNTEHTACPTQSNTEHTACPTQSNTESLTSFHRDIELARYESPPVWKVLQRVQHGPVSKAEATHDNKGASDCFWSDWTCRKLVQFDNKAIEARIPKNYYWQNAAIGKSRLWSVTAIGHWPLLASGFY